MPFASTLLVSRIYADRIIYCLPLKHSFRLSLNILPHVKRGFVERYVNTYYTVPFAGHASLEVKK